MKVEVQEVRRNRELKYITVEIVIDETDPDLNGYMGSGGYLRFNSYKEAETGLIEMLKEVQTYTGGNS